MKDTRKVLAVLLTLLVLLMIEVGVNIYHLTNYEGQKQAGNERWKQIEQRIVTVENKVHELEIKLNK